MIIENSAKADLFFGWEKLVYWKNDLAVAGA
jgi:hypothetical protein